MHTQQEDSGRTIGPWARRLAGLTLGLTLWAPAGLWAGSAQAEKAALEVLHQLNPSTDGQGAAASLVLAADGRFYGVNSGEGAFDAGTLFSVDKHGQFSVVHSFNLWIDGGEPVGRLVAAPDGWLYGVSAGIGCGALYRVAREGGAYERLHVFARESGGCSPKGLVQDRQGVFYGTTADGGLHDGGTVFRWDHTRGIDVLHHFSGVDGDGEYPLHPPTLSLDHSMLYGVTNRGGNGDDGTAFRLRTDGSDYRVLHAFGGTAGWSPSGELLAAKDGRFYGLSGHGGAGGYGTLYQLSPDGQVTVRHAFSSFSAEGQSAAGRLTEGEHGLLYGTTTYGGPNANGTLFALARDSSLTILHAFSSSNDDALGYNARGGLVRAHGYLYGGTGNRQWPFYTAGALFRIRQLPSDAPR